MERLTTAADRTMVLEYVGDNPGITVAEVIDHFDDGSLTPAATREILIVDEEQGKIERLGTRYWITDSGRAMIGRHNAQERDAYTGRINLDGGRFIRVGFAHYSAYLYKAAYRYKALFYEPTLVEMETGGTPYLSDRLSHIGYGDTYAQALKALFRARRTGEATDASRKPATTRVWLTPPDEIKT